MDRFATDLRARVRGEVTVDRLARGLYATDASMYEIEPLAVAVPRDEADVIAAVTTAAEHSVPIIPRGGGTALAGQSIGRGLILDTSKYLNALLEVDPAAGWARCQPGLVRDELNAAVARYGLHLAPDPATSNRANIGGMIAINSSGTRSIRYGRTIDHVLATRALLTDGTLLTCRELEPDDYAAIASRSDREGRLYAGFREVIETHRAGIIERFPKVMRHVGGYMLDEFVATDRWNLSKVLCGSEGTLATLVEATVKLEPLPRHTALVVAHFERVSQAIASVSPVLEFRPTAVELVDHHILELARTNLETAALCDFLVGAPAGILVIEFSGDTAAAVAEACAGAAAALQAAGAGYAWPVLTEQAAQARVWAVRKAGLGLQLGMKGDAKPAAFIEDAAVPLEHFPEYIARVEAFCAELSTPVVLYGHASVGLLHVRPVLNLKTAAGLDHMKRIANHCFELVQGYGGSFSGEHGDGIVRSHFLERAFGAEVYGAFRQVKALFDPAGLMNPGRIVDGPPMDEDLRYGPAYRTTTPADVYRWPREGSFAAAVEMCNGVGACRKTLGGTMCPSYMATRDEEHSTRGRANALRLAMSGKLGPDALTSDRLHQVLDLCLSCKACKSECPSNVDVAKLKSEFLQHYHDRHAPSLRERIIAASPALARLAAGPWAPVINALQASRPARWILSQIGFDPRRTPPAYARQSFAHWFARHPRPSGDRPKVVLFEDTYLNYHEPRLGRSAVELLEGCGYEVLLAHAGCCQRPRISHGFLRAAARDGEVTLRKLDEYLRQGLPVVVCEPGCASALVDDLPDLVADEALGQRVRAGVLMIDVFLDRELTAGRIAPQFTAAVTRVLVHGHCHQKSLFGTAALKRLLGQVPGLEVAEVDSGCCGMAGSFGYEREHYDVSRRVAEDRLLGAVRALPESAEVVACGFSCRHQLADLAGRPAVHLVELLHAQTDQDVT